MKPFVRLMSVCSVVLAGAVATPAFADDDSSHGTEVMGTHETKHGGMERIYERAVEEAQLRPEQKTEVDKLMAEGKQRHEPVKKAKGEFMLALADQIDSGKIDRCALAPETKKVAKAKAEAMPGDRAAMNKLHSILDATQRGRFVDSLKKQYEEAKKAHNTDAVVEHMDKELKLTDAQKSSLRKVIEGVKQIRDAEPAYQEHREKWGRILEAFKGDQFDIDKIAPTSEDAVEKVTKRIEARLWAAEAVIPILNEEQRATVAKKLRDKAHRHIGSGQEAAEKKEPAQDQAGKAEEQEEHEEQEAEED